MKDRASTGALLVCLLPVAMAAAFGLASPRTSPASGEAPRAVRPAAGIREPIWAQCLVDLPEALRQPGREFRSSLPFRGIATAALSRPSVVLASYEFEHNQDGPELENLTLALNELDRLMLPPGGELSFNSIVGPRLESRGFQPGLMYSQGKVITGVGGGVCVASTALYNAALEAGLPIVERWMHSGPTSYASPTRDAAVVFGAKDMRVKNNTGNPIWILTHVENGRARLSLLSMQPLPYRVALREVGESHIPFALEMQPTEEPEPTVIQKGHAGCNVKLVREFWSGSKLRKSEMICRDIRKPSPRIVGVPATGEAAPEVTIPGSLPEPVAPAPGDSSAAHSPVVEPLKLPGGETDKPAAPPLVMPGDTRP